MGTYFIYKQEGVTRDMMKHFAGILPRANSSFTSVRISSWSSCSASRDALKLMAHFSTCMLG